MRIITNIVPGFAIAFISLQSSINQIEEHLTQIILFFLYPHVSSNGFKQQGADGVKRDCESIRY